MFPLCGGEGLRHLDIGDDVEVAAVLATASDAQAFAAYAQVASSGSAGRDFDFHFAVEGGDGDAGGPRGFIPEEDAMNDYGMRKKTSRRALRPSHRGRGTTPGCPRIAFNMNPDMTEVKR